jgi:hypothetical protein
MSSTAVKTLVNQPYKYGFVTDIEADTLPRGLNEDIVRLISAKKNEPEFMLEFRLKAYRQWLTMSEPNWANVQYPPIDYQNIIYYSAPKQKKSQLNSLDEVDPTLLETRILQASDPQNAPLGRFRRRSGGDPTNRAPNGTQCRSACSRLPRRGVFRRRFLDFAADGGHAPRSGAATARSWRPVMRFEG